jgi:hypothetical protein
MDLGKMLIRPFFALVETVGFLAGAMQVVEQFVPAGWLHLISNAFLWFEVGDRWASLFNRLFVFSIYRLAT